MVFISGLRRINIFVCQVILATIMLSVAIDVGSRYILRQGFIAAGEFVPYLFTWFSFLGAALVVRDREHFMVDIVVTAVKGFRPVLEILIRVCEIIFYTIMAYFGWGMTVASMSQHTPYLDIPYGLIYLSVPVSSILMTIYVSYSIFESVAANFLSKRSLP